MGQQARPSAGAAAEWRRAEAGGGAPQAEGANQVLSRQSQKIVSNQQEEQEKAAAEALEIAARFCNKQEKLRYAGMENSCGGTFPAKLPLVMSDVPAPPRCKGAQRRSFLPKGSSSPAELCYQTTLLCGLVKLLSCLTGLLC